MRYLLDSNIFIFLLQENFESISHEQYEILNNPTNKLLLSEASLYEIGIKVRTGKLSLNLNTIEKERKRLKIGLLKSKQAFYTNIPKVPLVLKKNGDKHGDPFDLLIISQALIENLPVLSSDEYFPYYEGLTTVR
jgi:PIN domain nuclease of toxin-antitoxin system